MQAVKPRPFDPCAALGRSAREDRDIDPCTANCNSEFLRVPRRDDGLPDRYRPSAVAPPVARETGWSVPRSLKFHADLIAVNRRFFTSEPRLAIVSRATSLETRPSSSATLALARGVKPKDKPLASYRNVT